MDDCVLWPGQITKDGYGRFRSTHAHRHFYEKQYGPIPEGMTVDHLCFTKLCVNPRHLRLLTSLENQRNQRSATKTHCVNGHEFTPENTYDRSTNNAARNGRRGCRKCNAEAQRRRKARIRDAA